MKIRDIVAEDFVNYKKPSMFISMGDCDWKCCVEQGVNVSICQNSQLAQTPEKDIDDLKIIEMYLSNPITSAIVIGGLEPLLYPYDLYKFISEFRKKCNDDIVIYTGYYPHEVTNRLTSLSKYDNIIIKFGRFILNDTAHLDEILGVELASNNQYAVRLNKDTHKIIRAMEINKGYCPCKLIKNDDTKCCCAEFRNQDSGNCQCGLFSK